MEISISHPAHMFVVSCHGGKGFMVYYLYRWFSYLDWALQPKQRSNRAIPCDFLFLHRAELPFQAWLPFYCAKRFQWMLTCGKCSTLKKFHSVFFFFSNLSKKGCAISLKPCSKCNSIFKGIFIAFFVVVSVNKCDELGVAALNEASCDPRRMQSDTSSLKCRLSCY